MSKESNKKICTENFETAEKNIISFCLENEVEIQDIFKFLFQSYLGCEHLVSDYSTAFAMIGRELSFSEKDDLPDVELLDGDYCRIHLKMLKKGISPETLCRLFILSSEKKSDGVSRLEKELDNLVSSAKNGEISFSESELIRKINKWKESNFSAVHHSEKYRSAHHPAYRVVKKDYLRIIPLLIETDQLLHSDKENIIIAVDGRCASGKTTMAKWLEGLYDCNVFHMDDFFLPTVQKTKERLSRPGENVDHERFLDEILLPLHKSENITYRKYDCSKQSLEAPITVPQKRLNIVEGVYSLHPKLFGYYDLTVFSDVTESEQKERIVKRNSPEMAKKFFSTWIPLEEYYFEALNIREKANIIV